MTPNVDADLSALERERRAAREARRRRSEVRARRRTAEMRSVRFPVAVHVALVTAARRAGLSINSVIIEAVVARLGLADVEGTS